MGKCFLWLLVTILSIQMVKAEEPPVIPVGLDAYRMWDRWPYQRIGARAYMRSTYDRSGGNEGADASHFLYQQADDFNVALDVEGPGILYFVRYNHWHGSPWHYEVDAVDHLVQESSTANPTKPAANAVFMPADAFPSPLAVTWAATRGADLSWVPVAFERSFRMAYSRTHYGTGYYIYHQYLPGARLSRPITAWDTKTVPDPDVLALLERSGSDIAPADIPRRTGTVQLDHDGVIPLCNLSSGPGMVRALKLSLSRDQAIALGRMRLRVTWDDRPQPSIDAPLCLLFGAGTLYNRDDHEFLVKSLPVSIRYDKDRVELACYFPMPFFKSARFELAEVKASADAQVAWEIRSAPYTDPANHVGYFHATYCDHPQPQLGHDLVLLDTRVAEGGGDWSGNFVGTSFIFSHRAVLNTLEGDPRFFFDDSRTPQAQGTGTEEWGGGGDYWGGQNMTLPLAGHPCGARNQQEARCPEDLIQSAYRFLLADLFPFGKNAVIQLEHGGVNESTEHYETVAYWYGLPSPALVKTDQLDVGNAASEHAHAYSSPQASPPESITSRYELGPDTVSTSADSRPYAAPADYAGFEFQADAHKKVSVYPPHTQQGRHTTGTSEFTVRLRADNWGVLLRRALDYSYPNQRAEVFVADASGGQRPDELRWQRAGVWYLAGSNKCVYSNPGKGGPGDPRGELGATQHIVHTSNRRFRDDEFLVGRPFTQGRSAIRVRVQFTPVARPLFPGQSVPELAWSELHYDVYCYVLPKPPGSE